MFPRRRSEKTLFKQQQDSSSSSSSSSKQLKRLTSSKSASVPILTSGSSQINYSDLKVSDGNGSGLLHLRVMASGLGVSAVVRDCGNKQSESSDDYSQGTFKTTYRTITTTATTCSQQMLFKFLILALLAINPVCVHTAPVTESSDSRQREPLTLTKLDESDAMLATLKPVNHELALQSAVELVDSAPTQEYEELSSDLLISLDDDSHHQEQQQSDSALNSPFFIRRLMKRSGISDQRLAEMQMIRALRKQLERASKIAASNLNPAAQGNENTS